MRPLDRWSARGRRLLQHGVDLGGGGDVVGHRDAAPAARVLDGAVSGQFLPPHNATIIPPAWKNTTSLRVVTARPAQRFVEGTGPGEIMDAERDEGESLFHVRSFAPGCVAPTTTAIGWARRRQRDGLPG